MMSEPEYRKVKALNYSMLADFNDAPAKALMKKTDCFNFQFGKAFEQYLQDSFTSSNDFNTNFVVCDTVQSARPMASTDWYHMTDQARSKLYKYNKLKKGETVPELAKSGQAKHEWLQAMDNNPGKYPLTVAEFQQLKDMMESLLACQFMGLPLEELFDNADWQVPHVWESNGLTKKCLFDCIMKCKWYGETVSFGFDIKTAGTMFTFNSFLRNRYFWQDLHYAEGLLDLQKDIFHKIVFAVVAKDEPYTSQCVMVDDFSRENIMLKYHKLCQDCDAWIKNGMPKITWKEQKEIKVYA